MLYIIIIYSYFLVNIHQKGMRSKKHVLLPKYRILMEQVGENLKLARKRRRISAAMAAERAGFDRSTLYQIEQGKGNVSLSGYLNLLRVLGMEQDILKLGGDDVLGRKLEDLRLLNNNSKKTRK
jgi:DNA-binding XRE family transcriptional regulator